MFASHSIQIRAEARKFYFSYISIHWFLSMMWLLHASQINLLGRSEAIDVAE